jgi:outer membrane protein TolC
MRRLTVLLAALVLVAAEAGAQIGTDLSLGQAIEAALGSQPVVRAADLGIALAEKRVSEARTERFPSFRLTETVTRSNNPVFVFGSLLEQGRFGPQNFGLTALNNPDAIANVRTAVAASVPAFDGFRTSAHVAEAKIQRDQSVLQKSAVEQRTRFEVLRQYFGVLVAQTNLQVADRAVQMAESDLRRTQDRLDAGLAVESDRLAGQVQLAEFTQQQIESEGNLATAVAALNVSMGSPPQTQHNLTQTLAKKHFVVPRQEELVQRAMLHRPDYLQASSGIEFAERRVSERQSSYFPELNLFASYGGSGRNWTTGSTDYAVGAGITFNLFDPGRGSRISQARIEQSLASTERDRIGDQIVVEVTRAYQQYRSATQQLEVAEATLAQATEALRIIQDRYEAGLTTITDLLRAETALVRARMTLTAAGEAVYIGYANILLAIGELNDVYALES